MPIESPSVMLVALVFDGTAMAVRMEVVVVV